MPDLHRIYRCECGNEAPSELVETRLKVGSTADVLAVPGRVLCTGCGGVMALLNPALTASQAEAL